MSDAALDADSRALPSDAAWVEVIGDNPLARAVRAGLGERGGGGEEAPPAIVETSGDAQELVAALRRVADLGTVVLAGPVLDDPLPLDLYADVHVRGLTVVGVATQRERNV
jgi:threonine dehydrogenase-like Zn-dependent dehydrogenase